MTKSQLICCVKNEGVYILEWLAHHRMIGFDEIVIYSNDSDDGTHELLDEAANLGLCKHFKNQLPTGASPLPYAYRQHLKYKRRGDADVMMSLDIDEFLTIHVGDGNLTDLIKALPNDADIACFLWINFGAEPLDKWVAGNVTEQFMMAVPAKKRINYCVKSLVYKPEKFTRMGSHHPKSYIANTPIRAVNASGEPVPVDPQNYDNLYKDLRMLPSDFGRRKFAQINHYATKSADAFMLRRQRGRSYLEQDEVRHTQEYFNKRNTNLQLELSYLKYIERLRAQLAELRAMGRLNELELISQRIYREKLAALYAE